MIKNFEKTLKVQIDDTTLRCIVEKLLDEIIFDSDLIDCISDSLDDESREAYDIMIENDGFVRDEIVDYVKNAILEKFEIEKSKE